MSLIVVLAAILMLSALGYGLGRNRALACVGGRGRALHSLPSHYGAMVALWCVLPGVVVVLGWLLLQPHLVAWLVVAALPGDGPALSEGRLQLLVGQVVRLAEGGAAAKAGADPALMAAAETYREWHRLAAAAAVALALAASGAGFWAAYRAIAPRLRARDRVETVVKGLLLLSSTVAVLTTVGIVLSLLFEAVRFFNLVSPAEFLFGLKWSPQIALRDDQVAAAGAFGALPLLAGTMLITAIAMLVAVPVGLFSAVYLAEYAGPRLRAWAKPLLEILAGVPTVVYGFFAALTVAPLLRDAGLTLGLSVSSESALAAGLVMGMMIIPFVSSISDDVIRAVPQDLRNASLALGATDAETVVKVVLPAALPGIVGGVLLAVSRAVGETMIVVMAAGLAANLTANPLEAVTTVTVQIVTLLVGDQEFDSAKTLAAFALGLLLFVVTLALNVVALLVTRRYRERYE